MASVSSAKSVAQYILTTWTTDRVLPRSTRRAHHSSHAVDLEETSNRVIEGPIFLHQNYDVLDVLYGAPAVIGGDCKRTTDGRRHCSRQRPRIHRDVSAI
jgi:hypothetical protein